MILSSTYVTSQSGITTLNVSEPTIIHCIVCKWFYVLFDVSIVIYAF